MSKGTYRHSAVHSAHMIGINWGLLLQLAIQLPMACTRGAVRRIMGRTWDQFPQGRETEVPGHPSAVAQMLEVSRVGICAFLRVQTKRTLGVMVQGAACSGPVCVHERRLQLRGCPCTRAHRVCTTATISSQTPVHHPKMHPPNSPWNPRKA